MNTATRAIGQHKVNQAVAEFSWSSATLSMSGLLLAVLLSALAVIYVKDTNRRLVGELQSLQHQYDVLQVEKGKLLLEHGALTTQARVQYIAQTQLDMVFPMADTITMVDA